MDNPWKIHGKSMYNKNGKNGNVSVVLHGSPWGPMGTHGAPMRNHGFPWVSMGPHGSPWVPMGSHGFPWVPMGSPWVPMGPVLWVEHYTTLHHQIPNTRTPPPSTYDPHTTNQCKRLFPKVRTNPEIKFRVVSQKVVEGQIEICYGTSGIPRM